MEGFLSPRAVEASGAYGAFMSRDKGERGKRALPGEMFICSSNRGIISRARGIMGREEINYAPKTLFRSRFLITFDNLPENGKALGRAFLD